MFSVVIPLYNKEDCVLKTLNSVLGQSYGDFEVVIVDDGSTDNSLEVVSSVHDERIRVYSQLNAGPSAARNRGIQQAEGDFVAFIDADDLWHQDFLMEMSRLISDFPDGDIYGFNHAIIKNGEISARDSVDFRGYVSVKWDFFPFFYWTSSSCCRTKSIKAIGGFDERIFYGEDWDVWLRLLLNGRGVLDSRVMAYYFKDVNYSMTKQNMPLEKHIPYFIDKYEDYRLKNSGFRKFFDAQMIYRLYPYLFDKQYQKEARRLSKKIDYSQLKRSMGIRMRFPYIYRMVRMLKEGALR